MERLAEIYNSPDEVSTNAERINQLPENKTIEIKNVSFKYTGPGNNMVLNNINVQIKQGQTTAIVGTSGSGKTTLIKLLLGFYEPISGEIRIGGHLLKNLNINFWRDQCGAVMQDGFIFSDTIAENIAPGDENIDRKKLRDAVNVSNIQDFIDSLPLGFNTKIGLEGSGISQGQKQRLLIARVVYKDPEYIFFDEATNSLDANNEMVIMHNLDRFFKSGKQKTVIVVAHRLSTVKNADQIIVMEKGYIVERGTHPELTNLKGAYYQLVKNQLELGN